TGHDGFTSRHRFVAYGTYDLPVGHGRAHLADLPKKADGFLGGWQVAFNMFAKSGTAYTPFWDCNGCGGDPSLTLGNIGSGSADLSVNPKTLKLNPIDPSTIIPNTDFGRFLFSNSQEAIAAQRQIRLSLRLTF